MTRAKKAKKAKQAKQARRARPAPPPPPRSRVPRGLLLLAALAVVALVALVVTGALLWRSGGEEVESSPAVPASDPGPVHVHGLGVDPADGALFVATHTGLYRVGEGQRKAKRVGDGYQDTMGFTIVGPNRFLGSGHPDARQATEEGLPPRLGLIESTDAGASWQPVSLLGEADFHVLRFAAQRVYGYDASNDRLLASDDRGRTWQQLERPGPLVDLAVDPAEPRRLVAASAGGPEEGLFQSRDGGRSWTRLSEAIGLLAWPAPARLYLLTGDGRVFASRDGGRRLEEAGELDGQPAAFLAQGADELYVALHDGTIHRSSDGGASWALRSAP